MTQVSVTLDEIEQQTRAALVAHGAEAWIAAEVAKAVRVAEAKGNLICGLYYLDSYCQQLRTGRVKGDVLPEVTQPKAALVKVDAQLGFAQPAFAKGLPTAIEVAREMGSCSLAVCHAHTCTSLGYFTEQIARAGLMGIGFTNASAVVSPPGGNKAVLGTNPIAMAVPAQTGGVAFQFDQSTSAVALGKITMAASAGESIPTGWAVDSEGRETTDPHAALKGSLVSTGGYKGFGFGLMTEVLAGALLGGAMSLDVKALKAPEGQPHNLGQFYFLLDPQGFAGEAFWANLKQMVEAVEAQPNARMPGTRAMATDTVMIEASVWQHTQALAQA